LVGKLLKKYSSKIKQLNYQILTLSVALRGRISSYSYTSIIANPNNLSIVRGNKNPREKLSGEKEIIREN
jgi:hypothetical protein